LQAVCQFYEKLIEISINGLKPFKYLPIKKPIAAQYFAALQQNIKKLLSILIK